MSQSDCASIVKGNGKVIKELSQRRFLARVVSDYGRTFGAREDTSNRVILNENVPRT
jgi:hypothetical protein